MKKTFVTAIICVIFIAFLSNFTTKSVKSFVITTVNEAPVLPETPFDYNDITFPEHLLTPEDLPTGYEAGPVDTSTIAGLDNDIATLGRVLFYDEKLSALENISCASCHLQEKSFADDVALSEGISSLTKRNSMALNDLGWSNKSHFFWDMSETDLHEMIVLPLTDENEIGANMNDIQTKLSSTEYYPELFEKAFGTATINEERIVDAIVHFINSMVTFNSKFDRASANKFNDFTEEEIHGLELFSAHCTSCHSQGSHNPFGIFNEEEFFPSGLSELDLFPFIFNNGLPIDEDDNGAGGWNEDFENLFKVPSLRNVALTGPYMHDGRFESLDEVLDHYSEDVEENEWTIFIPPSGFNFNRSEKDALIAFMNTLTDESFKTNEKWSNPFEPSSSIPELTELNFVIKPNPMFSEATIEFENPNNDQVLVNILSSTGQLIETRKINDEFITLDKNRFSAGMYFVQVQLGEAKSLKKLIVQ